MSVPKFPGPNLRKSTTEFQIRTSSVLWFTLQSISNESCEITELFPQQRIDDQKNLNYIILSILFLDIFPISVHTGEGNTYKEEGYANLWATWQLVRNLACVARQNENNKVCLTFSISATKGRCNFFYWGCYFPGDRKPFLMYYI